MLLVATGGSQKREQRHRLGGRASFEQGITVLLILTPYRNDQARDHDASSLQYRLAFLACNYPWQLVNPHFEYRC